MPRKKISGLAAAIKKDIKAYATTYAKEAAKKAQESLKQETRAALDNFYNSYDPESYRRTYNLMLNSFTSIYKSERNSYTGGVRISSDTMDEYKHAGADKGSILEWTFGEGRHGKAAVTTPPIDILTKAVPKCIQDAAESGKQKAKAGSYQVVNFK